MDVKFDLTGPEAKTIVELVERAALGQGVTARGRYPKRVKEGAEAGQHYLEAVATKLYAQLSEQLEEKIDREVEGGKWRRYSLEIGLTDLDPRQLWSGNLDSIVFNATDAIGEIVQDNVEEEYGLSSDVTVRVIPETLDN